jgi:hypothetical protein
MAPFLRLTAGLRKAQTLTATQSGYIVRPLTWASMFPPCWVFQNQTGYVYSQIGTYTADEVVTISGDILQRAQLGSINNGFNLQLLSGDFPGAADGTALGVTLLATHVFSRADLESLVIGAASSSNAYSVPFSVNLNSGTSGTDGSALWLRITRPAAGGEVFLDNLVAVSTPEPSVAFLSGSGLLTLILFRRRQRE